MFIWYFLLEITFGHSLALAIYKPILMNNSSEGIISLQKYDF